MTESRKIQMLAFALGFFGSPLTWIAIHHLLNYKQ
jgi:hypothetical protein